MPELPEVETTVRQIRPAVVGRRIRDVRVHWAGAIAGSRPAALRAALAGARVERVWRRAKFFIFDLSRARRAAGHLIGHLRMSGRLSVVPAEAAAVRYARLELILEPGQDRLVFSDLRKFGRLRFARATQAVLGALGPEPLSAAFTPAWLAQALSRRKRCLKPLLLDQAFIAGLGNIYTDEALFLARLHPLAHAHTLDRQATTRLHAAIRRVLKAAIRREGSSFDGVYRTPRGAPGRYQERLSVYGRTGEPCRRCGTPIQRIVVGQRGTHICPRCQPLRGLSRRS